MLEHDIEGSDSESTTDAEDDEDSIVRQRRFQAHTLDNSIKFWEFTSDAIINDGTTSLNSVIV